MAHVQGGRRGLQMARWDYKVGAIRDERGFSCGCPHPQKCSIAMRIQTFRVCDCRCAWTDGLRGAFVERDQADDFDKVPHVERGSKTSRASCRHNVTWPCQ